MLAVYNGFSFTVEEEAEFWNAFSTDWELDTKALYEKYTAPDKSIIDVGAWIGPTVLIGYANNAKHIYAIEADPANAHILKKNCMRNFIDDRVTIITRCMYPVSNETIRFGKCLLQGSGASSTKTFGGSAKVLSSTLIDSIIDNNINLDEVNILKIDIEGAELLLVRDLIKLSKYKHLVVFLSLHQHFWKNIPGKPEQIKLLYDCYDFYTSSEDALRGNDISEYIENNVGCMLLLKPKVI